MGGLPAETEFKEEDMADMFWEIPATEVKWAVDTVRTKHRAKTLSFSMSKESNQLNCIGMCDQIRRF